MRATPLLFALTFLGVLPAAATPPALPEAALFDAQEATALARLYKDALFGDTDAAMVGFSLNLSADEARAFYETDRRRAESPDQISEDDRLFYDKILANQKLHLEHLPAARYMDFLEYLYDALYKASKQSGRQGVAFLDGRFVAPFLDDWSAFTRLCDKALRSQSGFEELANLYAQIDPSIDWRSDMEALALRFQCKSATALYALYYKKLSDDQRLSVAAVIAHRHGDLGDAKLAQLKRGQSNVAWSLPPLEFVYANADFE